MTPIGASAAGVAGVVVGKVAGTLLKGTMWFALLPLLQIPLVIALSMYSNRGMAKSFRNPDDKRANLFRDQRRFRFIYVVAFFFSLFLLWDLLGRFDIDERRFFQIVILGISGCLLCSVIRQLRVDRGLNGISMAAMVGVATPLLICMAFFDGGVWLMFVWAAPMALLQLIAPVTLPYARMDYHLFLRQALGGMGSVAGKVKRASMDLSDADLKRFDWWLGCKKLLIDRKISLLHAIPGIGSKFKKAKDYGKQGEQTKIAGTIKGTLYLMAD